MHPSPPAMKIPASFRFQTPMFLCSLAVLCALATGAFADERNPNLLERIGNFFYKVANKLERSDGPDDPGRNSSLRNRSRPPVRGGKSDGKVVPGASRNTDVVPVNRDPRQPWPREPAPENSSVATARDQASGRTHPAATPGAADAVSVPVKPTAPLPEPAKPGKAHDAAGSSSSGATSRPRKGGEVPAAVNPGESGYPTAIPTNRLGRVKSPYPPHRELDVTGLPSGSLAKDPVTGRIFRLP